MDMIHIYKYAYILYTYILKIMLTISADNLPVQTQH